MRAVFVVAAMLLAAAPARADNPMGYRLVSPADAAGLPRNHGALGMDVERAQSVTNDGMTFDIIRITRLRDGSAAARADLRPGDQIIALNGMVFANLASFGAYVGSLPPGGTATLDYLPRDGGPAQARRVALVIGGAGAGTAPVPSSTGLSTGAKVAIGAGAVALFGCYELGCFSHRASPSPASAAP